MLINIIISVVLAAIIGGAITYIVLSKKQGAACVGCPYAKECGKCKNCGCGSSCGSNHAVNSAHYAGVTRDESDGSGSGQLQ